MPHPAPACDFCQHLLDHEDHLLLTQADTHLPELLLLPILYLPLGEGYTPNSSPKTQVPESKDLCPINSKLTAEASRARKCPHWVTALLPCK